MAADQKKIYCVGIGGIGLSAMAKILHCQGHDVSGSDQQESEVTDELIQSGLKVHIGHAVENIPPDLDLVLVSPAVSDDNLEYCELTRLGVPIFTYPEALGSLSAEKFTIAVAGSHGKSTTTAIIGSTLVAASYDPTVIVGTKVKEFNGSNVFVGKSKFLVVEACEYKKSFLNLRPDLLVLLNIDMDHFDFYPSEKEYLAAFADLIARLPADGKIIANAGDENVMSVVKNAHCSVVTFALDQKADYSLQSGSMLYRHYNQIGELKLQLLGKHNRENALAAYVACDLLSVPNEIIFPNLYRYRGSWRRLDFRGKLGETKIYDDYAHHPTEIKATISALREEYPQAKICCVFQPHQYNRTRNLLKRFGPAFSDCDEVIIPGIYAVRDTKEDLESVGVDDVIKEIKRAGVTARSEAGLEETLAFIQNNHSLYDIIVIMGAGDVYQISQKLFSSK